MSSRALRKLHGDRNIVIPGLEAATAAGSSEDEADEGDGAPSAAGRSIAGSRKRAPLPAVNPFDLLTAEGESEEENESKNEEISPSSQADTNTASPVNTSVTGKPKKKKKKKKKKAAVEENLENAKQQFEDEIDVGIREVNRLLGELPSAQEHSEFSRSPGGVTPDMRAILTVEHKNLNPDNEMRRIFGSRVVQSEARGGRRRGRIPHRTTWLTRPKDNWPHMGKTGLTMESVPGSSPPGFTFVHNHQYQQAQVKFWDSVESLNPQNIVSVVNIHPYHIDALLQLSEICRMSEDTQMATELVERALYACECSFHTLFNLSSGNCRLDYRRQENRPFYLALFRHLTFVGQRGCYRTALEFCKILLSLDPDSDPLCVLLLVDFYALKAGEYGFLIRLYHEWESHRNLSQLPNFAFSVPLAMFLQATQEDPTHVDTSADELLQSALLMFPGVLLPLLDKCSINPDKEVTSHAFFSPSTQFGQPEALSQLSALYIGRCYPCWKAPDVVTWLEKNVKETLALIDRGDPRAEEYAQKRAVRYCGTPRNIYRHILISEVTDATATLPPELTQSPVLSYDPLPPTDAIVSYTRPPRPRAVEQDGNALSMFFRSLLPNFNPQEVVEEPGGAAGGQDLRQGIGALMDAMRDLLNNIQPVAPPVENGGAHNEADDDGPDVRQPEEFD